VTLMNSFILKIQLYFSKLR